MRTKIRSKYHLNQNRIMQKSLLIPNSGRMPAIEHLPINMQKPIFMLSQQKSVISTTANYADESKSVISLEIRFHSSLFMNWLAALSCFSHSELTSNFFEINMAERFMKINLHQKRFVLN